LDAGHGGYDPGAIGRDGIKEKYIVLDITRRVKRLLEDEGIEVILTRDSDNFVTLSRRSEIANRSGADLFISIHANASKTKRLKGFEIYYLSEALDDTARATHAAKNGSIEAQKGRPSSFVVNTILWDLELTEDRRNAIELGNSILDTMDVAKRDIKSARFIVLKGSRMPAILIEGGYISNKEECAELGSEEYRAKIADEIATGILRYKRKYESSGGFTD
ncbi:MAG: N-acetylmuramoyl-L-alanine amidase, partial [Candidatus Omnitrophica bacterium]|nr:N-acetylmuramoyl-L-alanine amidase [Candidatus Omnitrophota bacterium]